MGKDTSNLEVLSTREGLNSAVRHINKTIEISGNLEEKNLADLLSEQGDENLTGDNGAFLLRMLLVDKLKYITISRNLKTVATDLSALAKEFQAWQGVDLIAAYHHPDLGLLIANPKVAEELIKFEVLIKHELLVIYAGKGSSPVDASCHKAAELALCLFEGKKIKAPAELLKGNFTHIKLKKEEPLRKLAARTSSPTPKATTTPTISGSPVRMTPMYSVVVSNELFHNGNVEAWKRIIASYTAQYPTLQVFIYYEGERILDINTLFKWGKVKHGSAIQFAVSGNDIKDVAKLQHYFTQAASNRFEAFLRGPVHDFRVPSG